MTFTVAEAEFEQRKIAFGTQQMQTLKIINSDGIFTNLGMLLSDQCKHSIKTAVFQGTDQSIFRDRREFSGSLFKQLNDVYAYLDRYNQTKATFHKLLRIDTRDYPEVALREALLNLIVHRLCKALHNRCYAKLIVMQRKFLFYRKQGLFSFFNLA